MPKTDAELERLLQELNATNVSAMMRLVSSSSAMRYMMIKNLESKPPVLMTDEEKLWLSWAKRLST